MYDDVATGINGGDLGFVPTRVSQGIAMIAKKDYSVYRYCHLFG